MKIGTRQKQKNTRQFSLIGIPTCRANIHLLLNLPTMITILQRVGDICIFLKNSISPKRREASDRDAVTDEDNEAHSRKARTKADASSIKERKVHNE